MLIPVLLVRRVEAGPPRRCNVPSAMSPMPLAMLCHALPRLQDPPRSPVVTAAQPWRSVSANDSRGDAGVLASSSPETSSQPTAALAPGLHFRIVRPRGVFIAPRPGGPWPSPVTHGAEMSWESDGEAKS